MDRVILKNCKLAYSGVYSDAEADEFAQKDTSEEQKPQEDTGLVTAEQVNILLALFKDYEEKVKKFTANELIEHTLNSNKITDLGQLNIKSYTDILKKLKTDLGGK